ncbi:MAG: OmpA family protein [Balneolaceae bacterium]|jgi:outer membrane protein OmpA-like peptidoglycan-associated protein|nr:MAG: OmpA family protein [Balneolaceae bacterium]
MTITLNKISILALLLSLGILFSSCRTSEEIVEPEPQPTAERETVEEEEWVVEEEETRPAERVSELGTVHFNFDRYTITDRAARQLAENVQKLRDNPNTRVRVDAYTDHIGGDQYNLRLSLRRAAAVVDFYKQNGIAEHRIESRGLGVYPVQCTEAQMDRDTPGCETMRRAESHPLQPAR